ncbi:MAG: TraB/GumN family protein [Hyphomicrobium sp.]
MADKFAAAAISPIKSAFRAAALIGTLAMAISATAAEKAASPDTASEAKPAQCAGADMIAELATTAPDIHKKVMEEAARYANTEAVLWKVERAGLEPSYLFGTMHLSDPRLTTLSPAVKDAIRATSTLALEVADLSESALAPAIAKAGDLIVYSDGRKLSEFLTPDEFAKVQSVVGRSGMPGEFAGLFRPWLINMLLAMSDCERKQVASGAPVLDMKIAEVAQKQGMTVIGLETIEQQLGALASVPEDQQIHMLKVGLKYADRADDMMETMVQLYQKRQLGAALPFQLALAKLNGAPDTTFDGFKEMLLVERNFRMRDASRPALDKGKVFIAVGALHLPGSTGLVSLLREAGFTVTPVE